MAAAWTARRRVLLIASGLVSAALLAAALLWLPTWSHNVVIGQIESVFGRPVTADSVRFRFFPTEMEIRQLRVAGARAGDPPWLEVPRLSVLPSFGLLWEGRIVLSRIRIEHPRVRIQAFADGGDNMPRLRMGGRGVLGVRVRRLTIEGGELILDHQRVPLELDLPELTGRLSARRAGVLAGEITLGPGEARFGSAEPIPLQSTLDLVWDGARFTLEKGRIQTGASDLTLAGELRLAGRPEGHVDLQGTLELAELDRHVTRTGFQLGGASRYRGRLEIDGAKLALQGRLDGENGTWKGTDVPRFGGDVAWNENGVRIRGLDMGVLGGSAVLEIDVPPSGRPARVAGRLVGIDVDRTVARLFDVGLVGAGSAGTGELSLEWPRGRFREVSGAVALDLEARNDGRTPISGRFEWRAVRGLQTLERVDLRTPQAQALVRGRIERDRRADLALTVQGGDLAGTDELILRLRRALGNDAAQPFSVAGSGSFDGHWRGTLAAPVYEGRFTGAGVRYLGVDWGRVDWVGRASGAAIECRSLVARRAGAELWVDGVFAPGEYGVDDAVDVHVRLERWPAEDLARALEWDVDWTGPLTGRADVSGRRSAPRGPVTVSGAAGTYWGVAYEGLTLDAALEGDRIAARDGRADVGGGTLRFRGTRTDAGDYDGSLEAAGVEIGDLLPPVREGVRWGGRISGNVDVEGTLEAPRIDAALTSPRLFLGDEGIGALDAKLAGEGDGQIAIRARCESPRMRFDVEGHVGAAAPHAAALRFRARETSLDPFARALLPAAGALPPVVASGELSLAGPLRQPERLSASIHVPELQILLPEYPVRSEGAVQLELEAGRLTIRQLRLAGEGTNLLAAGSAPLFAEGALDLSVQGDADLRSLAAVTRRLRARGAATLAMTLRGTRESPRLDGALQLLGAGVRLRNAPHGLEEVQGGVRFTERAARLEDVVGRLGGGRVELQGEAAYGPAGLRSVDVTLAGRDIALRYPEGLRSLSDGQLRLFGDGERQWLTGTLDVRQAVWTRRYDVASEILAAEEALRAPAAPLGDALRFDIKVNAPGTLKVDNNLANLDARADLRLQGTADEPIVLGRADVDRGRVYFQGNTYVIRRGRIEFANPQRLDPFFDIEAETRQGSYRVNLKMSGTLDRVYPTLTSDPPLSAVQILNLLAGADEAEVARLGQAQTDRARLAEQGAASLAAGRIAEGMGLERQAERLFGLNRFSIDPSVLKGGITNPAARITVGKRLTPDLSVLYSVDLRGNDERLFSVEYTLRDWLSVLMTRHEPDGFGVDARVQRSR